ncbi:MAG: hypothetical protein Q9219_006894 [cf. Caloplaca sp. 3 TL-2023]
MDRFLIEHFNEDQLHRYEAMRRNKFRKETVRKIVNQTLSQSVPPSVVTGISGYTKTLVGLLIERARDVKEQNAAVAAAAYPSPPSRPQSSRTAVPSPPLGSSTQDTMLLSSFESSATVTNNSPSNDQVTSRQNTHQESDSDIDRPPELNHNDIFGTSSSPSQPPEPPLPPSIPENNLKPLPAAPQPVSTFPGDLPMSSPPDSGQKTSSALRRPGELANGKKLDYLGPLLPGDLREACRRYKRNGESAGIGLGGLSLMGLGVQGTFAAGRGKGRRLFG